MNVTTTHDPHGGGHPRLFVVEVAYADETGSEHRRQQEPRARGTSVEGGSDPDGDDPGEYF